MGDLYWGDNLEILRNHIASESVDLIYLDPPFNSNRNYNVLFRENGQVESQAQIEAFTDTWHWTEHAEATYAELIGGQRVPRRVSKLIESMREFIGSNDVMAYLVSMTVRLIELHRVLKPSGSIYLHCDPTASHYLKVVMDTIWGPKNYINEIVWKRSSAHSDTRQGMRRCGKIHDVILFYAKQANSKQRTWNPQYTPYTAEYLEAEYDLKTPDGRHFADADLTGAKPGGDTSYDWRIKRELAPGCRWEADLDDEHLSPRAGWEYKAVRPYNGRYWAYKKSYLVELAREGRLWHRSTGMPRQMNFANDMPGIALQDIWDDIPPASGGEHMGYDTQKPEALLDRIILASSNEGDVVLDPFCGCGTAIAAAERLHRRWVGIDITHLAIAAIVARMESSFGEGVEIRRHGEPVDVGGARALAAHNRFDFENWALTLVQARPDSDEKRKGADRGIDGYISFLGAEEKAAHTCVVQVKSGSVSASIIRDLKGTVEREKAQVGLLITLEPPTAPMVREALEAGYYRSELMGQNYARIQILTIKELLEGKQPHLPPHYNPFQLAQFRARQTRQKALFDASGAAG